MDEADPHEPLVIHRERVAAGAKLHLIELLLALATGDEVDLFGIDKTEYVRASFALVENGRLDQLDRLVHETVSDEHDEYPLETRGVCVELKEPRIAPYVLTLIELLDEPVGDLCFPSKLELASQGDLETSLFPELSPEESRAAFNWVKAAIYSLQGNSRDASTRRRWSRADRRTTLESMLRSLNNYRRDGEP